MSRAKNGKKLCSKCLVEKDLEEFTKETSRKDGLYPQCKDCCREKLRPLMRVIMRKNYYRKFGLTVDDYNNLFSKQEGKCAICGQHQSVFKVALAVDHDHTTGKIRGLLCNRCNPMLGYAKDDVNILQKSIEYLKGD